MIGRCPFEKGSFGYGGNGGECQSGAQADRALCGAGSGRSGRGATGVLAAPARRRRGWEKHAVFFSSMPSRRARRRCRPRVAALPGRRVARRAATKPAAMRYLPAPGRTAAMTSPARPACRPGCAGRVTVRRLPGRLPCRCRARQARVAGSVRAAPRGRCGSAQQLAQYGRPPGRADAGDTGDARRAGIAAMRPPCRHQPLSVCAAACCRAA